MRQVLGVAAGGGVASVTGLLIIDRVMAWCGAHFWGRLSPSSRVYVVLALTCITTGMLLPVPGLTNSLLWRVVAGLCGGVFVFTLALQAVGLALDARNADRYRGRHR